MDTIKTNLSIATFQLSLKAIAASFRLSKDLRKEICNPDTGFVLNAKYLIRTRDDAFNLHVEFKDGKMTSGRGKIDDADTTIVYKDKATLARVWSMSGEDTLDLLLTNEMNYSGNMAYLSRFSYLTGLLLGGKAANTNDAVKSIDIDESRKKTNKEQKFRSRLDKKVDRVEHLPDPYLADYSLTDFPRLLFLRNRRFGIKPTICIERADLLTKYHKENGFETDKNGKAINPNLRQAQALHFVLENKKPIIWDKHLIPGSTTTKEVGVPLYPEFIGTVIWNELKTIQKRTLNPNNLSAEDAEKLDIEIFPYWQDRTVREYCRRKFNYPLSQQLDERWVLYFLMKNNAISHTIPDFRSVLKVGLSDLIRQAAQKQREAKDQLKFYFYQSMQIAMDGVLQYANHLSEEAKRQAALLDPQKPEEQTRKEELERMSAVCQRVPAKPAESVYEAVTAIWIVFSALHQENANSALSIGRLDQLLQPYFMKDMEKVHTPEQKEAVIKNTIEYVGSLCLKFNDHDPLVPSVGNKLFGGTSSDDTVTVGGVDRDGKNAVNDMTYIVLKVAEMLCFQDPNLNARYYSGVNSKEYLRRLCEVNINMAASPIIQNDKAVIEALVNEKIPVEDARDWGASGCVEPDICGKHYGHTNCMLLNTVAPLEMVLNNGIHPVIGEQIGPKTGDPTTLGTFEDFLNAYKVQLKYLMEMSVEANNYLGESHKYMHPTPLLSSIFQGPMEKGMDIIDGGATYNTSGVALVSISDVIDSLCVIKELVYEKKELDFSTLLAALSDNFEKDENKKILMRINQVKKFGSDAENGEPNRIAQDLMDYCYDYYTSQKNYRGGIYWPGYWSISYHVGFGMLSGALPSGRKRGKAFTPGLTPSPNASDQVLDNIHDVSKLNNLKMPNNIAFNVKLVPHSGDSAEEVLNQFTSYVQSYMDLGGMQWQCNVISSDTMREAVKNPDDYRWLIVRISGYNAYFVKLNSNMQEELIERAEYCSR
jgi:formate C-acetyltransferase